MTWTRTNEHEQTFKLVLYNSLELLWGKLKKKQNKQTIKYFLKNEEDFTNKT